MHTIGITPLTLTLLFYYTEAHPRLLEHARDSKVISSDLQQLTLSYRQCHVHIVLFSGDVDIHGIQPAYTITRMGGDCSDYAVIVVGGLAYPKMRHMRYNCQATFQVLPSKKQFYKLAENDQHFAYKRRDGTVRPDEGALAWYMMKRRYSFLIVDYVAPFRDTTAAWELGGNSFIVLKYKVGTTSRKPGLRKYSLESVTVICEHCLRREQSQKCSTISQCLHVLA